MAGASDLEDLYDLPSSRFGEETSYDTYEEESNPKCQNVAYLRYIPAGVCKRERKDKKVCKKKK